MAIAEVPCLNSDKDFKLAIHGFTLTQVYLIHVSVNLKTTIQISHISTKLKGLSQNNIQ